MNTTSEASLMHGLAQLAGAQGRRFQVLTVIRMKDPHELRPGNRYLREAEARRTLGELIHRKTALIAICHRCRHRRLLFPSALAAQLGATFKVIDLPILRPVLHPGRKAPGWG